MVQTKKSINDEISHQKEENDWITLNYSGHITYWRFPQTRACPSLRCSLKFASRSEARAHYQTAHAQQTILCPICDKPINAKCRLNYLKHHDMKHGNMKLPYDFMAQHSTTVSEVWNNCQFCGISYHIFINQF